MSHSSRYIGGGLGWPDARPYDKYKESWCGIKKLGIYMVQLAMHNLFLIYEAGASGVLLSWDLNLSPQASISFVYQILKSYPPNVIGRYFYS